MKTKKSFYSFIFVALTLISFHQPAFADGDKSYNLKLGVLPFLVRGYQFEFDFKVSENFAIAPQIVGMTADTTDPNFLGTVTYTVSLLGARGTYFFNGAFNDGLYISPMLSILALKLKGTSDLGRPVDASASGLFGQALVGYHWFGENLNFGIGAGLGTTLGAISMQADDGINKWSESAPQSSVGLALEMLVGYAF